MTNWLLAHSNHFLGAGLGFAAAALYLSWIVWPDTNNIKAWQNTVMLICFALAVAGMLIGSIFRAEPSECEQHCAECNDRE